MILHSRLNFLNYEMERMGTSWLYNYLELLWGLNDMGPCLSYSPLYPQFLGIVKELPPPQFPGFGT